MAPAPRRLSHLGIAAFLLGLARLALAQAPGPGLEKTGDFRVLIDDTGKLKSAAPLDATLGDALNRALVGAAKDIVFQPAMRDGKPASFESQLHLVARFVAVDTGGYKLELVSAALGPQALVRKAPVFPRELAAKKLEAVVVSRTWIRSDGSVDPTRTTVLQSVISPGHEESLPVLERVALEALTQSRFQPDLVGGKPVEMESIQSIRFCGESCSLAEPAPSAERLLLPRIAEDGVRAARVPAALAVRDTSLRGKSLRFRIAIDANGGVSSATALVEGDAALLERTRQGLLGLNFFPATMHGRPVSSEMPVSVPVRIENGSAQPNLARLDLEPWQMSLPTPRFGNLMGPGQGEVQARLHIVTLPDGRADRTASSVESLKILPVGSVAVERALRKQFMEAIGQAHMDPVLVDGKGISLQFWRSYFTPFCIATTSCSPERRTSAPADPPAKLPEGIELARVKP